MDPNPPAFLAARSSWRCVMSKDKEGWLGLMADDVRVEDPIGWRRQTQMERGSRERRRSPT